MNTPSHLQVQALPTREFAQLHMHTILARLAGQGTQPRSDQVDAVHAVLQPASRVLVVQATGWGKSAVYWAATHAIRSTGAGPTLVVSPLLALLLSTVLGLILTPALIQGWLGLPRLGTVSAAVASFLSTLAAWGFLAVRLRRIGHVMAPNRKLLAALRFDRVILGKVLRIGLPTGVQMVVISLSELLLTGQRLYTQNFLILETIQGWQGFHSELVKTSIKFEGGFIIPPTEPGLGIELQPEVATRSQSSANFTPVTLLNAAWNAALRLAYQPALKSAKRCTLRV